MAWYSKLINGEDWVTAFYFVGPELYKLKGAPLPPIWSTTSPISLSLSPLKMVAKFHFSAIISLAASVTCLASPPIAAPAGRAVSPRSVPTSWSIPHRVTLGTTPGKRSPNVVERQRQIQQIPFQWCPEFFHKPPKLCSDCGGDTKVKGTCDNILVSGKQDFCPPNGPYDRCYGYFCQCSDDGGPDNSPKVTSTTVIDGVTGTAVWEPITFTEYRSLRASTTVTLTETATATGGSEVETVVAVIFAGGVAWWLASQSGAVGAALALQPPTARPEGSQEDDTRCTKNPKEKCPDCGGADALGLCKSGSEAGCPCDEEEQQECPADGPPQCSSTDCGGDDGESQCKGDGKLKGCKCCPDTAPTCTNNDCNGDNNRKCQAPNFKGCSCQIPDVDTDVEFEGDPPIPNAADLSSAAADVFTRIWGADYSKVPGYIGPTPTAVWCQHGGAPSQPREPKEYCQCGNNFATFYSVATTGTNPCPFNPSSTGILVTFSTPSPTPPPVTTTSTTSPTSTTTPTTTTTPCNSGWCGAPFCFPECQPP